MKKIKKTINVLFVGIPLVEFKKLGIILFEEKLQKELKIVHIPRIIDLNEKEIYERELMRYNKKIASSVFRKIGKNEKFDIIVLNASEVHDYGIKSFNLDKIIETFAKKNHEIIVERCIEFPCKTCDREIEDNFPHIPIVWKRVAAEWQVKETNKYILEKIMERIDKK